MLVFIPDFNPTALPLLLSLPFFYHMATQLRQQHCSKGFTLVMDDEISQRIALFQISYGKLFIFQRRDWTREAPQGLINHETWAVQDDRDESHPEDLQPRSAPQSCIHKGEPAPSIHTVRIHLILPTYWSKVCGELSAHIDIKFQLHWQSSREIHDLTWIWET